MSPFTKFFTKSFTKPQQDYSQVPNSDDEHSRALSDDEILPRIDSKKQKRLRRLLSLKTLFLIATIILLGILITFFSLDARKSQTHQKPAPSIQTMKPCQNPAIRREWRSLSRAEKNNYIEAVQCLANTPSRVRSNGTLYDDFPWVHSKISHITHGAAPFLTWHRYFIHVYETELKGVCGYTGSLPYWDWTLDWENMAGSPIWDNETGFGGNGQEGGMETIGHGRCVVDGPFANLKPLFYASKDKPHCLSRGFTEDFSGYDARPEAIEQINLNADYKSLFLALENGPHNVVPQGVRGDFYSFTAPYDPVFFLHHAQLDRIWWLWQMRAPGIRTKAYSGRAATHSEETASLDDVLPMGGLARDIVVREIMRTESELLCYRYF